MSRRRPPRDDYEVGYCKPPTATRFGAGNPGRPKGSGRKPASPTTMAEIVEAALLRPRQVRRGERIVTMTAAELLVERIVAAASSSSSRENAAALRLMERYLSHLLVPPPQQVSVTYHDAAGSTVDLPSPDLWGAKP